MTLLTRATGIVRARWTFGRRRIPLGARPKLEGRTPLVRNAGQMRVGRNVILLGRQYRSGLTTGHGGSLVIGDRVLINQGVTIHAAQSVQIGDDVRIADLVAIYDTDFHEVEPGAGVRVAPVKIGDNAWLGRSAIVLPGVSIGAHAVVAAGAVVTKDVPPHTLVAGAPARVVRQLAGQPGYRRA